MACIKFKRIKKVRCHFEQAKTYEFHELRLSGAQHCLAMFSLCQLETISQDVCIIGPSGVCALPLAAGINEGGHYFR